MPDFRVLSQTPRYTLDTVPLPSVTEALRGVGLVDEEWFTARACQRGRAVHIGTALLDRGRLDWDSVKRTEDHLEEAIVARIQAWARFKRETGFTVRLVENAAYDPVYFYAGTLDRTGFFPNTPQEDSLLDLKTGAVQDWTEIQLGGYDRLTPLPNGATHRRLYGLELGADGEPRLKPFYDRSAGARFLGVLSDYRWRQDHGYFRRPAADAATPAADSRA